jgi:F-type H+-transporting ATPase subunit a
MGAHYNFFQHLTPDPNWQKASLAIALGTGLVVVGSMLTKKIANHATIKEAIVPPERINLFGFADFFVESFVKYHDSIVGKENRRFAPFTAGTFLFLLTANLIGLVPGFPAITTTVWINVAVALATFLYFNYLGIKAHGVVGYLKHFAGPVWWLAVLIFPLEIFSTCLRVLTLNLRLYWNITADHIVLGTFTELVPLFVPVLFFGLGTFVCFVQAFVFTTLSMVYILLATQHEEGEHHDGVGHRESLSHGTSPQGAVSQGVVAHHA